MNRRALSTLIPLLLFIVVPLLVGWGHGNGWCVGKICIDDTDPGPGCGGPCDTTPPPQPYWTSAPSSTGTYSSPVSFAWDDDESGVTYECNTDSAGWTATGCASPKSLSLSAGEHSFAVRALDAEGNASAQRKRTFTIGGATACSGTDVEPGDDLDAIVNGTPSPETFCLADDGGNPWTYAVNNELALSDGDEIIGVTGSSVTRGPATYGVPTVSINGTGDCENDSADTCRVIDMGSGSNTASNVRVEWVHIKGADGRVNTSEPASHCPSSPDDTPGCPVNGTGVGISMGNADGTTVMENIVVSGSDGLGIGNAIGRIGPVETYDNTNNEKFLGVVASGIKFIRETEVSDCFVHQEAGNGVWHDHSTSSGGDVPRMSSNPVAYGAGDGGTWIHDCVSVDNGRKGFRLEFSPKNAATDQHLNQPGFVLENSRAAGNGDEGASVRDAQNATIRGNTFGAQTIGGVSYGNNGNLSGGATDGVNVSDSGRDPDRTDTKFVRVTGNTFNGTDEADCTSGAITASDNVECP